MSKFKIEDFPPRVQAQIMAQLEGYAKPVEQMPADPIPSLSPSGNRKSPGPNKTELEYQRIYLRGLDARYEAITFRMANGHKYTPDWVVFDQGGGIVSCHECKGSYALHSHQRARLAFDQARVEFAAYAWHWAAKTANGWDIKAYRKMQGTSEAGGGANLDQATSNKNSN